MRAGASLPPCARAAGTSLLVSLDRALSEHVRGHWAWTLGPGGGIATGVSRSTGAWAASAELRVGAGMVRPFFQMLRL
jgi:hypothetical protein